MLLLERPPVQPGARTLPLPTVNATQGVGPGTGRGNATSGHGGAHVQPLSPVQSGQQGTRALRPQSTPSASQAPAPQPSAQQPSAQQPGQAPRQ
ncbi:hypothetical protein [Nitratidesulfovibrio liaohensis]|uniref:Uncharacterized protein n=1 Tax=Nitratidesulfovibrio liaohensis TaxID=2604158 RepID=A0ABY9R045_9BACT|nr:hypothetical protein [Nitratidesulfovibrio liaohensis]WMW65150.1 hypothetical protein KPS_003256 [Nitratidesulfovibrio liaohensis]